MMMIMMMMMLMTKKKKKAEKRKCARESKVFCLLGLLSRKQNTRAEN